MPLRVLVSISFMFASLPSQSGNPGRQCRRPTRRPTTHPSPPGTPRSSHTSGGPQQEGLLLRRWGQPPPALQEAQPLCSQARDRILPQCHPPSHHTHLAYRREQDPRGHVMGAWRGRTALLPRRGLLLGRPLRRCSTGGWERRGNMAATTTTRVARWSRQSPNLMRTWHHRI